LGYIKRKKSELRKTNKGFAIKKFLRLFREKDKEEVILRKLLLISTTAKRLVRKLGYNLS